MTTDQYVDSKFANTELNLRVIKGGKAPLSLSERSTLIALLKRADTPTEIVREALGADQCELRLMFGKQRVVVRDIQFRSNVA